MPGFTTPKLIWVAATVRLTGAANVATFIDDIDRVANSQPRRLVTVSYLDGVNARRAFSKLPIERTIEPDAVLADALGERRAIFGAPYRDLAPRFAASARAGTHD